MAKKCDGKNEYMRVKEGWYNFVLKEPLEGAEDKLIQYIIEVNGSYGVASIRPLTIEDIDNINLNEWEFKPFSELEKELENNRKDKIL